MKIVKIGLEQPGYEKGMRYKIDFGGFSCNVTETALFELESEIHEIKNNII